MKKIQAHTSPENILSLSFSQWLKYFFTVVMMIAITSCGGESTTGPDPDPDPDPDPNPDPPRSVTFSQDIQPIFTGTCAVAGCHDSGTQESGVNLSTYDDALNSVGVQYGTEIINPGNPDESPIVDKISNSNPQFGARMPEGGSPLSSAQIDSIIAWIEDGAPNN